MIFIIKIKMERLNSVLKDEAVYYSLRAFMQNLAISSQPCAEELVDYIKRQQCGSCDITHFIAALSAYVPEYEDKSKRVILYFRFIEFIFSDQVETKLQDMFYFALKAPNIIDRSIPIIELMVKIYNNVTADEQQQMLTWAINRKMEKAFPDLKCSLNHSKRIWINYKEVMYNDVIYTQIRQKCDVQIQKNNCDIAALGDLKPSRYIRQNKHTLKHVIDNYLHFYQQGNYT
jgi:hypothetical protein